MMILNNKVVNLSIKPSWVAESSFSFKTNKQTKTKPKENKDIKLWSNVVRFRKCSTNIFKQKYYTPDVISSQIPFICLWVFRLQNRLYFYVFKYVQAVKQKVWNEAENRERDWGFLSPHTPYGRVALSRFARVRLLRHALPISLLILRKKTDCFAV